MQVTGTYSTQPNHEPLWQQSDTLGLRSRGSCKYQFLITVCNVVKLLAFGNQVLLDFSRALVKTPHQRLLHKLHYYGVRRNTWNWLKYCLVKCTQTILYQSRCSFRSPLKNCDVATALYDFINELPKYTSSEMILLADNRILYMKINCNT